MSASKKGSRRNINKKRQRPSEVRRSVQSRTGHTADQEEGSDDLEQLFDSLRSGAANVAGVTYQIAATAWLLANGNGDRIPGLDIESVAPEGFEDIDCRLHSGQVLHIQTKERGLGSRAIAVAEVAEMIVHAVPALQGAARFAIVTNGKLGSSLPQTGFTATLDDELGAIGDEVASRENLIEALRARLRSKGRSQSGAEALLSRVHLVVTAPDMADRTVLGLEARVGIPTSAASLLRAELLRDLAELAARQRQATLATLGRRTLTDLDLLAIRVMQDVDVPSLEEAIAAGICEPADYVSPSSVERAEFFAGIDVLPAHIAAGFDVVRPEETAEIVRGLEERQDVVVAGPSGSGKSALLWRSARMLELGLRIVRVHRVADADDVELLVRHVRRQQPTNARRLLVVADDLGRDRMAAWPEARGRIREIPGVLVLGGVRREDLTPQISASAVIVDPILTTSAASRIYEALLEANVPTPMAREEAVSQADGLLMEFIALATRGRRLYEVLSVQVSELDSSDGRLLREALRLVCAAHLLGAPVPADSLPEALDVDADAAGRIMARLAGEYLVIAEGAYWHGLHDLRTEVLFDLLHAVPPPSAAASYARALRVLPDASQGPAARRAAVRLGRYSTNAQHQTDPEGRLDSLLEILEPIAVVLRDQLVEATTHSGDDAAAYAASLIEAGDRLDTVAYVHAVLPFVEESRPPTASLEALAGLLYSSSVDHINLESVEQIARLARQMPKRRTTCARWVLAGLTPTMLVGVVKEATVSTAIRLLEAAEGLMMITAEQARDIYDHLVSALPDSPGLTTRIDGDLRAQLTASLAILAQARGAQVAASFGSVEARASDAVACDDYGCRLEIHLQPSKEPAETPSQLARSYTYNEHEMMVAHAVTFARPVGEGAAVASAYSPRPGEAPGSLHEQAILLARRLTDACPEIDQMTIEVWQANCRPSSPTGDDVKSLRAGVLKRRSEVARNIAFQAGVRETLNAENWTRRLRDQATLAQELIRQLEELPERLRSFDNQGRRRDWIRRVHRTAQAAVNLTGRPAERQPVLAGARSRALHQSAGEIDERVRAADKSKVAYETLTGALQQVSENLDDPRMVRLAGSRFSQVPALMREARADGFPVFSGIGETLPIELDRRAAFVARLLTALDQAEMLQGLHKFARDDRRLDQLINEAAAAASQRDGEIVAAFLGRRQVQAQVVVISDENPIPEWRSQRAVMAVELGSWERAAEAIAHWASESRAEQEVTGRVVLVPVEGRDVLPMGLGFFGAGGTPLPLLPDDLGTIATEMKSPARGRVVEEAIQQCGAELVEYSYELTRRARRDPLWSTVPVSTPTPEEVAAKIRQAFGDALEHRQRHAGDPDGALGYAGTAATLLLDLCERVATETGDGEGLAAQLASIDVTDLAAYELGPACQIYVRAQAAAVDADRAATF